MAVRDAVHAEMLAALGAKVEALQHEVRDLRAQLKLDSHNSSKPPSSDPPGGGAKSPPKRKGGRRQGGQLGHEGRTRERFAPAEVDRQEEHRPTACHVCGRRIVANGSDDPVLHQVVDLPPAPAEVTEHVLHRGFCPCCKVTVTAPLPPGVPRSAVGPRLQAVLALLVGRFRLSRREAAEAAVALFGPKAAVSVGTVSALEGRTSVALAPAWEEAEEAARTSLVTHADETSFGRGGWLWTACTAAVSFFRIDPNRSRAAFERLLGEDFPGVLVTDRWASYHRHPSSRRQLCWAHLKRNGQGLVDRGGSAVRVGRAVLTAAAAVFSAWEDHRARRLSMPGIARRLTPARRELLRKLQRGRTNADRKAAALCKDVVKHFASLWTFTKHPGVEPTNNLAEREIRPAVLWRKGCFGASSDAGCRFTERMLTVTRTLRRRGRDVLAYLELAIRARLAGKPAPSLLMA